MTLNFSGPYQVRIFYDVEPASFVELRHMLALNIDLQDFPDPGEAFGDIDVLRRVGTPVPLSTVVDGFVVVFKALLSTAEAAISHAELWKYTAGTEQAAYVSTYSINEAGGSGSGSNLSGLTVWSFRTVQGGIMKIYVLEGVNTENPQQTYTDLTADEKDWADWFTADATSYSLGKDTTYPHAFLRMSPSRHESVFSKRFRL